MAETHFISWLKQRRAESLGELEDLRKKLADLEAAETKLLDRIEHIDALIKHEDPSFPLDSIKPRKPRTPHPRSGGGRSGPHGERMPVVQAVLRAFRKSTAPMSIEDVLAKVRQDYPNHDEAKLLANIRVYVHTKVREGLLVSLDRDGDRKRKLYSLANR